MICGPGPLPVPPPKAADLTITDITFSPPYPVKNDETIINIYVKNKGDATASNIGLRVWVDETPLRDEQIDTLSAGEDIQVSISYVFTSPRQPLCKSNN